MSKYAIGVDVGGSHITSAAVDLASGKIIESTMTTVNLDNTAPPKQIIDIWSGNIESAIERLGQVPVGVGFAMPGPFDYQRGICEIHGVQKYFRMMGVDVTHTLQNRLRHIADLPIKYVNDAGAFALGEAWAGKGSGHDRLFITTLGTGFGSGFVINGDVVVEHPDVPTAGCVYYMPYADSIADDNFSTRWFCRRYKELTGKEVHGARQVAENAVMEDAATKIFEEYGQNMAEFLSPILRKFCPDIYVMGGNISKAYHLFGKAMHDKFEAEGLTFRVEVSELKEIAAIVGAASLLKKK